MRSERKRSADHVESEGRTTKRRKQPKKSGVPKQPLGMRHRLRLEVTR